MIATMWNLKKQREAMKTTLKLFDGCKVTIEQTMTGITAQVDGEEPKRITSDQYMQLVSASV